MHLLTIYPVRDVDNKRSLLFRSYDALDKYRSKNKIKMSTAQQVPVME